MWNWSWKIFRYLIFQFTNKNQTQLRIIPDFDDSWLDFLLLSPINDQNIWSFAKLQVKYFFLARVNFSFFHTDNWMQFPVCHQLSTHRIQWLQCILFTLGWNYSTLKKIRPDHYILLNWVEMDKTRWRLSSKAPFKRLKNWSELIHV